MAKGLTVSSTSLAAIHCLLVKLKQTRSKGFARPGDDLTVKVVLHEHLGNLFDFSATISVDDGTIMRNGFQLANIPSKGMFHGNRLSNVMSLTSHVRVNCEGRWSY